jgi:hypothetical protein
LRRTENYGSNHYEEHPLTVEAAKLADDQCTVQLMIPELKPTWGMEIQCDLRGIDGTPFRRRIHNSIISLPDATSAGRK